MDYDRLDTILKERHISRRKLAEMAGLNVNTFLSAFRRRTALSAEDAIRISSALGVDLRYLLGFNRQDNDLCRDMPYEEQSKYVLDQYGDLIDEIHPVIFDDGGIGVQYQLKIDDGLDLHGVLLQMFDLLNENGKREALKRIIELTELSRYRNDDVQQEG